MPYIVKILGDEHIQGLGLECVEKSRRDVATSEEAIQAVFEILLDRGNRPVIALGAVSARLSESGGTIGPLEDGTIIEVEPTA